MTDEFAKVPPKPMNWQDVFGITGCLRDVPIEQIERGRVDWEYNFDPKDQRSCGRMGCEQKHAHGWLVALPGLRFVNIGNDCARKYASAGLWSASIDSYRERISAEARAKAFAEVRDAAQQKQYWLDNTPEIQSAIAVFESFASQARGPLLSEIERRAERGLALIERDRRLSDEEIELRHAMASAARLDGKPAPYVATVEKVTVGTIEGLECFRPQASPRALHSLLQQLVSTLLKWQPADDDRDANRSLVTAMRNLAPLSNGLNMSLKAVERFFTNSNLTALRSLEVARSQGIVSISLNGAGGVDILRRAHWSRAA